MLRTLGLDHKANNTGIKQAYLALVRRWHPDRVHGDEHLRAQSSQKLTQINVAYSYLCRTPPPPPPAPAAARPSSSRPPSGHDPLSRATQTAYATRMRNADSASPGPAAIFQFLVPLFSLLLIIVAYTGLLDRHWTYHAPKPFEPAARTFVLSAPVPTFVLPAEDTGNIASVAGTYHGMTANTTLHKAASTLLLVRQHGNQITGCFIVAPPMRGSGPINGEIRKNLVIFNSKSSDDTMLFVGTLAPGAISGSIVVTHKDQPQQSGEFSLTRKSNAATAIPPQCPRDRDPDVATGKLTMPWRDRDIGSRSR